MSCRATRRERVLVSRAVHPHYRQTLCTYFGGASLAADEIPLVADGPAAGTTDLEALERMLADPEHPVAGVVVANPSFLGLLEPMAEIGRLAHAAGALFVSVVEPVSLAVLASPGEYGADIAAGEGQPLGHPARLRRPVPRHPGLPRGARPPDPRPSGRHDHGRGRPAGLRDDAARPRAGHPPREGGQQHLHEPGPVRPRGLDLSGRHRAARPAGRGRPRAPLAPPSWRRLSPPPAPRGCIPGPYLNEFAVRVPDARGGPRPPARPRHPGRPAAGAGHPGRPVARRRAPRLRHGGHHFRRDRRRSPRRSARSLRGPPDDRRRRSPRPHALRALPAGPRRRQGAASAQGRAGPDSRRASCARTGRACPRSPSRS